MKIDIQLEIGDFADTYGDSIEEAIKAEIVRLALVEIKKSPEYKQTVAAVQQRLQSNVLKELMKK